MKLQGYHINLRWEAKPGISRDPNRNRKSYEEQVIHSLSPSTLSFSLSLSPGLHIAHLCVSLCIWLILLLFLCIVFSLFVPTQGSKVAILVLASSISQITFLIKCNKQLQALRLGSQAKSYVGIIPVNKLASPEFGDPCSNYACQCKER